MHLGFQNASKRTKAFSPPLVSLPAQSAGLTKATGYTFHHQAFLQLPAFCELCPVEQFEL